MDNIDKMWREYYMYQCVCLKYWYRKWNSSFFLCFEFYLQTSNIMRTQNWINLNPKATLHLLIKWYPYQRQCIIQQFQIISVKSIFFKSTSYFFKKKKNIVIHIVSWHKYCEINTEKLRKQYIIPSLKMRHYHLQFFIWF